MRITRATTLAAAIVVALVLSSCTPREEREEAAREDAKAALSRGDREEALASLERLRAAQPDTPEALLEYAELLVAAGEAPEAVWVLEDGVARFDDHALRLGLATALLMVNDPARARAVAGEIPAGAPQHLQSLLLRAQAALKLGELDAALADFERAEREYPEESGVQLPRIAALVEQRRWEDARTSIAEARAKGGPPEVQAALRRLEAAVYGRDVLEGDAEAALAGLRALVEEAPDDDALWNSWIQALLGKQRQDEARAVLEEALDEDPEHLALYTLLASVENAVGDGDAAEATLRRWIATQPSASAHFALAMLVPARREPDAALAAFDDGLAAFPDEPLLRLGRAEALIAVGRLDESAAALDELEAADADPRRLELMRARIALERGQAEEARQTLELLVPEFDDSTTHFWLGRALEETGDLAGAERRYGIALNRSPHDPAGALAIFRLASARGDWADAAAYASIAMSRAAGRADVWRAFTMALVELGDAQAAVELAKDGVARFPDDDRLRALYAAALRMQGQPKDALAALGPAAGSPTESAAVASERGLALAAGGDPEAALAALDEAAARMPEEAQLSYARAMVLYQLGRSDEGDAAVERALTLDPDDVRPLRRRLEYRAAIGRLEPALADAKRYLALRPDDAHAWYIRGVAHDRLGHVEEAVTAYRRAAELDEKAVAPRNNLADLLGRQDRIDEALEAGQQAYRLDAGNPYVLDTLGWLYLRSGRVDRAISLLEEAKQSAPDLPDAQLHLAYAYREAGRDGDARTLLLALRPNAPAGMRAEVEKALAELR